MATPIHPRPSENKTNLLSTSCSRLMLAFERWDDEHIIVQQTGASSNVNMHADLEQHCQYTSAEQFMNMY